VARRQQTERLQAYLVGRARPIHHHDKEWQEAKNSQNDANHIDYCQKEYSISFAGFRFNHLSHPLCRRSLSLAVLPLDFFELRLILVAQEIEDNHRQDGNDSEDD
jgi:hypothetical protein